MTIPIRDTDTGEIVAHAIDDRAAEAPDRHKLGSQPGPEETDPPLSLRDGDATRPLDHEARLHRIESWMEDHYLELSETKRKLAELRELYGTEVSPGIVTERVHRLRHALFGGCVDTIRHIDFSLPPDAWVRVSTSYDPDAHPSRRGEHTVVLAAGIDHETRFGPMPEEEEADELAAQLVRLHNVSGSVVAEAPTGEPPDA